MRILLSAIGGILMLTGAIVLLATLNSTPPPHQLPAYLISGGVLMGGALLISAAYWRYRGGWRFLLGTLLIIVDWPFILAAIQQYRLGSDNPQGRVLLTFAILLAVLALGFWLLISAHRKHLAEPPQHIPEIAQIPTYPQYRYAELTPMRRLLHGTLITSAVVCAGGILANLMQYQLLTAMHDGAYTDAVALQQAAQTNDQRQHWLGYAALVTGLASFAALLGWTYRASANAHSFSRQPLQYRPLAAVAWYFVPIANAWHPYQAMKQIWQVSYRAHNWQHIETPLILPLWWFTAIAANSLTWIALKNFLNQQHTIAALAMGTLLLILSNLLQIISCWALWQLAQQIQTLQQAQIEAQN